MGTRTYARTHHLDPDKGIVVNDTLVSKIAVRLAHHRQDLGVQQHLCESRGLLKVLGCVHTLLADTQW